MNWTPDKIALLGKQSDNKLAARWSVHAMTVGRKRRSLGIKAKFYKGKRIDACVICGTKTPRRDFSERVTCAAEKCIKENFRRHPKTGLAETNIHAREWCFIDPAGERHVFTNLNHFVRENQGLFDPGDVAKAVGMLKQIGNPRNRAKSWRGWTIG